MIQKVIIHDEFDLPSRWRNAMLWMKDIPNSDADMVEWVFYMVEKGLDKCEDWEGENFDYSPEERKKLHENYNKRFPSLTV